MLTDGKHLVGSRLNRTLYHLRPDHLHICSVCGKTHVKHDAGTPYRAVEVASEPVTQDEVWTEVPNGVVFQVAEDFQFEMQPLAVDVTGAP